jgi:oligopeptide/dipeptide ABC transporter ATP-binding protein
MTAPAAPTAPLLEVRDIVRHFPAAGGRKVHAVNGVSLALAAGEVLALVGESGCGKSTLGRLILRLDRPDAGRILVGGVPIGDLAGRALRRHRTAMQMIFQDPATALDPRWTVAASIREPLDNYAVGAAAERDATVLRLLAEVGLRPDHAACYPHQLSGGQKQRVGIARALALAPKLIVADEPVSALDVSVRAQVINLLVDLKRQRGLSLLFISHDIGVVAHVSDRVAVMYLGHIVEEGPTATLLARPEHPYTRALLDAVPIAHPGDRRAREPLSGDPPSPIDLGPGCAFRARCPLALGRCATETPRLAPVTASAPGHAVACFARHADTPL